MGGELGAKSRSDLLDERRALVTRVEPYVHREPVLLAKIGHQRRQQKRRLAETRPSEQDSEWCVVDQAQQSCGFLVSAIEEVLATLIKLVKARPGIVGIDDMSAGHAHADLRRCSSRSTPVIISRMPS